jgi:hypothetical protein
MPPSWWVSEAVGGSALELFHQHHLICGLSPVGFHRQAPRSFSHHVCLRGQWREREKAQIPCVCVCRANGGSCRLGWHSQPCKPRSNENVPAVVSGSAESHFDQSLDHDHLQSGLQGSVMLVVHPEADQQK